MAQRKPKRKAKNIQRIQLCKRKLVEVDNETTGKKELQLIPVRDNAGNTIKINKFKFIKHG